MSDIAIIGAGDIGATLARRFAAAGHAVTFGARDPSGATVRALAEEIGATVRPMHDAVTAAAVVVVAIPGAAIPALVAELGPALANRVVIDATNDMGGPVFHHLDEFASRAPDALVYRAFNTLGWENFADPRPGSDLLYCGPDRPEERALVEGLITDIGLGPVYVGGLDQADLLDAMTRLWFALAITQGHGRRTAFRVLRD